jgi:hypothetical protein
LNGNITTSNPILLAQISDKYGINHSGAGIGHNISLTINGDSKNQLWLNDFFERLPDKGDGEVRGEIRYPMFDLLPGKYNIKLRVSNVFNVSTEASLDFQVVESENPIIGKVYNFPNPARDYTKFYFTHNSPKKIKRIEIYIFDISGRPIVQLSSKNVDINGFATDPIEWDLRDSRGNQLRQGLYFYRFRIILDDDSIAEKVVKLAIGG